MILHEGLHHTLLDLIWLPTSPQSMKRLLSILIINTISQKHNNNTQIPEDFFLFLDWQILYSLFSIYLETVNVYICIEWILKESVEISVMIKVIYLSKKSRQIDFQTNYFHKVCRTGRSPPNSLVPNQSTKNLKWCPRSASDSVRQ